METLKYSKTVFQTTFSVGQKLKDIVAQLEEMAQNQNKVVCRVRVNGLLLTENDEARLAETEYKDIEDIEVELESLSSLITSSVQALIDFATTLQASALESAELYRGGSIQESNVLFANIMPRVQCLADGLLALKPNIGRSANLSSELSNKWADAEKHMMKTVTELAAAFEKQDFVLVSDVLEYELHNSIDNWLSILVRIMSEK